MNKLLIEKRNEGFFVQYNGDVFECQHLADALGKTCIDPDHRADAADLIATIFELSNAERITLGEQEEGLWFGQIDERIDTQGYSQLDVLISLLLLSMQYKVAQSLPELG